MNLQGELTGGHQDGACILGEGDIFLFARELHTNLSLGGLRGIA